MASTEYLYKYNEEQGLSLSSSCEGGSNLPYFHALGLGFQTFDQNFVHQIPTHAKYLSIAVR